MIVARCRESWQGNLHFKVYIFAQCKGLAETALGIVELLIPIFQKIRNVSVMLLRGQIEEGVERTPESVRGGVFAVGGSSCPIELRRPREDF